LTRRRDTRRGSDAGEGRQGVRRGELLPVAADGREELRAQDGADAGDALDYVSEFVFAKSAFDELVQLGDLLVEGHHLPGRGRRLPRCLHR
jgi:hypothetical protein